MRHRRRENLLRDGRCGEHDFVSGLLAGGDSRLAIDSATGLNKYLCPPRPAPEIACLSSCTASPISLSGYAAAQACYRDVIAAPSRSLATERLGFWRTRIEIGLLAYVGAEAIAEAMLVPSGTDAVLLTMTMLALEEARRPITAVLPSKCETGRGIPMAATCRRFDGSASFNEPVVEGAAGAVEVSLRAADGEPYPDDVLCEAFATAARAASGRPVVYLTHCTKTGLVAPLQVPPGIDVVVDAAQFRIAPDAVRSYLGRGWPVIVTGSKFLGGPAFSGAVLLPRGRFRDVRELAQLRCASVAPDAAGASSNEVRGLGPVLRWMAALDGLSALQAAGPVVADAIHRLASDARSALAGIYGVTCLQADASESALSWGWPTGIVTFAVRDHGDPSRWLTEGELRPLHSRLARHGVLVGQPVNLGPHGALRVAISARDVVAGTIRPALERLAEELPASIRREAVLSSRVRGRSGSGKALIR